MKSHSFQSEKMQIDSLYLTGKNYKFFHSFSFKCSTHWGTHEMLEKFWKGLRYYLITFMVTQMETVNCECFKIKKLFKAKNQHAQYS